MKKSSVRHGIEDLSMMTNSVEHCCSTGIPPLTKTDCLPYKSSMDTPSKTYYQPIANHSPKNGNTKWKQQNNKQNKHYNLLKHTTTKMHTPSQKYKLDLMLLSTMLKQNCGIYVYGIVTHVSTHRHYCIKTPSSRVLVQKRCFLHCLIPASITVSVATADLRPHTYNRTVSNTTPINKA